jgi:hypothetical protein
MSVSPASTSGAKETYVGKNSDALNPYLPERGKSDVSSGPRMVNFLFSLFFFFFLVLGIEPGPDTY